MGFVLYESWPRPSLPVDFYSESGLVTKVPKTFGHEEVAIEMCLTRFYGVLEQTGGKRVRKRV